MKKIILLLLCLITFSFLFADLSDGLVVKYLFSGNAVDESGTGNDGTVYNAVSIPDRYGNAVSAYEFGTDKYILALSDSTLNITSQLTMAAWVYLHNGASTWQSIFCKGETSSMDSPYALLIRNYKITFLPNREHYYGSIDVPTEEWVHIVVTWDGNTIKYYINGVKDNREDSYSNTLNIVDNDLVIGKDAPGVTEWFNGNLDDLYLYNRALSESEVQELYQNNGVSSPQNVEITLYNGAVSIVWDEVSGATYNVYSSFDPDLPISQWYLEVSGWTVENWDSTITEDKIFYKVTAVK